MALFSKQTLLVSALTAALALGGCKSNLGGGAVSPLDNDEFSIDPDSYATSCVTGAVAVGVTCLLIADSNNRAYCFAAAAAGCAAFMGGNYLLDNLRQNYHTREQQLDGLIKTMQDNNRKAMTMAKAAQSQYQKDQKVLAQLQKDVASSKANKDAVEKQIALYNANIEVLEGNIEAHTKQLASYQEVRNSLAGGSMNASERAKLKEADRQIAQLEKDIKTISQTLDSYIRDRDVLNLAATSMSKGTKV